jgi:hypothetical protein
MQEEMIQMVDDDEIENVGIMSGFMDELEELISEIDAEDLEKNKGGDEADTAKLMGRTPNSPEILMNNLRGDMRSVDARREELADLVGMREAQETPEGVLTLLQSVLAQQEAASPMPMAPPMPPQGMPPEMMGGMPPEMMGGMPPQGMPPQGMPPPPMGIEAVMPDMPGMYRGGPVQNFNRGSGQMGGTPASDAFAAYPSDVVEEAKRRVRHMVDGGMVQKYDRGGYVQHFQAGSVPPGVTPMTADMYPAEDREAALSRFMELMQQQQQPSGIPTLQEGLDRNLPIYQDLLGTDPKDTQAQMLFDIGQAALGYAGNVGPDGQPLRGSAAARLAGATRELPGRIGARLEGMSKEGQALKMAALQAAQSERAAAIEAQGERFTTLTPEEAEAAQLDPVYTWQRNALTGELKTLGSRPRVPDNVTVTSGETYAEGVAKLSAQDDATLVKNATGATNNIAKLDEALALINSGNVNLGIGSEIATNFDRVRAQFLNDSEAQRRVSTDQYLDALLGSDVFSAIGSLGIGARGLDTPAEREFLRQVLTGTRALDAEALTRITELRRDREINVLKEYNNRVELGELDAYFEASNKVKRQFDIPPLPSLGISKRGAAGTIETAEEALARRRREEGAR